MKALIPAAGHGTRFRPVTRAVPKEMLPVGAKPAIQLIVEEAAAAGADEVVIVISPEKEMIRRYFEEENVGVRVSWAYQREQKGLGHAVLQAASFFEAECDPVLILLGDALVSGVAPAPEMAAASRACGGASVVGLERVPLERVSKYGIAATANPGERVCRLDDLVEKPRAEEAPSDLAVAGRYLLAPLVFRLLADQSAGVGGEIQLTDAIRRLIRSGRAVYGCRYGGVRHDIGSPEGYLETLNAFAAVRETS